MWCEPPLLAGGHIDRRFLGVSRRRHAASAVECRTGVNLIQLSSKEQPKSWYPPLPRAEPMQSGSGGQVQCFHVAFFIAIVQPSGGTRHWYDICFRKAEMDGL